MLSEATVGTASLLCLSSGQRRAALPRACRQRPLHHADAVGPGWFLLRLCVSERQNADKGEWVEEEGERDQFWFSNPVVVDDCHSLGWTRLKSGTQNSTSVSPMGSRGQALGPSAACLGR